MSAIEHPGPSSEPRGPALTSDDLEDWLSDLRTEVSADPSGWIKAHSEDEQAADQAFRRGPRPPAEDGTDAAKPSSGGRHRAPD